MDIVSHTIKNPTLHHSFGSNNRMSKKQKKKYWNFHGINYFSYNCMAYICLYKNEKK